MTCHMRLCMGPQLKCAKRGLYLGSMRKTDKTQLTRSCLSQHALVFILMLRYVCCILDELLYVICVTEDSFLYWVITETFHVYTYKVC